MENKSKSLVGIVKRYAPVGGIVAVLSSYYLLSKGSDESPVIERPKVIPSSTAKPEIEYGKQEIKISPDGKEIKISFKVPHTLGCDTDGDDKSDTYFKIYYLPPMSLGEMAIYENNGKFCAGYFFDGEIFGVLAKPLLRKEDNQPSRLFDIDLYGLNSSERDILIFDPKPLPGDSPIRYTDAYTLRKMFVVSNE